MAQRRAAPRRKRKTVGPRQAPTATIEARLARVERILRRLAGDGVGRGEHERLLLSLRAIEANAQRVEEHKRDLEVQFKRIAQIQADLDELKRRWERFNPRS